MARYNYFLLLPRYSWAVVLLAFWTMSCKNTSENTDNLLQVDGVARLRPSSIYKLDSISQFLANNGTSNQELANKFLEISKSLRKDKKEEAIWNLKMALTLFPEVSWYADLGDILMEDGNFNEAQSAYTVFLKSNLKPSKTQFLNMVKSAMLADDNSSRYSMAEKAKEMGAAPDDLLGLLTEYDIKSRLTEQEIESFRNYLNNSSGGSEADTVLADFPKFLKEFELTTLPFKTTVQDICKHEYSEEYFDYDPSRDYSNFEYERINKETYYPDYDYQYYFQYGNLTAVIYSGDTSATATTKINRCLFHRIMIFNEKYELISSYVLGYQAGEDLATYEIFPDGKILQYQFKRTWKKPYDKYNMDNELLDTKATDTTTIFLGKDGYFRVETDDI